MSCSNHSSPIPGTIVCRGLILALAALLAGGSSAATQGSPSLDPSSGGIQEDDFGLKVIKLEHAPAEDVGRAVNRLLGAEGAIQIDTRTNSLIVAGEEAFQTRVNELVALLDVEERSQAAAESDGVRVFALRHAQDGEMLAELLSSVFGAGPRQRVPGPLPVRIAYDPSTHQIIARGEPGEIAQLERLINELDKEPVSGAGGPTDMQVRLIWLVGGVEELGSEVPRDLRDVIAELERIGIDDLSLAAQTIVQVSADEEFGTNLVANLLTPWRMSLRGVATVGMQGTRSLSIELSGEPIEPDGTNCRLSTAITTVSGHYVVLGASPIGELDSVYVIQVTDR